MPSITPSPQVLALASHQPPAAASSSSASAGRPAPSSTARQSLTAILAASPLSKSPGQVRASRKYLPKHNVVKRAWWKLVSDGGKGVERRRAQRSEEAKQDERDKVALCGSWVKDGTRPTDLFLDIYGSVLQCLNHDPRIGVVSPQLIGTTGTLPLSIISLIPDIIEHHATLIRSAQEEVLLFTNYWQISNSQRTISDALIALSDRIEKEHAEAYAKATGPPPQKKKVIVKVVYDRGTLRHLIHPHSPVPPSMWPAIDLPKLSEIPNLDMQVLNYHRLLLGTFHAKFLVVDRKAALLCSNNIQDRPNLEMMVHLEGEVVQSLYDTALISFSSTLTPTLPLLRNPPPPTRPEDYTFQEKNQWLKDIPLVGAAEATRKLLRLLRDRADYDEDEERKLALIPERGRLRNLVRTAIEQGMEAPPRDVSTRTQSQAGAWFEGMVDVMTAATERSRPGSRSMSRRNSRERKRHSLPPPGKETKEPSRRQTSPPRHPEIVLPLGSPTTSQAPTTTTQADGPLTPLSATPIEGPGEYADFHTKLQSSLSEIPLTDQGHASKHVRLVVDEPEELDRSEVQPGLRAGHLSRAEKDAMLGVRTDTGSKTAEVGPSKADKALLSRLERMSEKLNAGVLSEPLPTVEDTDAIDEFTPHIFHASHKPVPMALVNRGPRGTPGHQDLRTPQNAAWLAGFKCSKKRIFIQTPTFNARPVVDAAIDACKRGVEVVLYVGLGFNDKGESIPFQGGTNEEVTVRMYNTLRAVKKEQFLKVYWYVGKDQNRPLNAVIKQRNCHVKLAIFDDAVGMCGNGNQDTQSWYHSQETNVLIDSTILCADWIHTLSHNQNTHLYGLVDPKDGRWRNEKGQTVEELDQIALAAKEKLAREVIKD